MLSLGRVCDEFGCSKFWQPGGNPTLTTGKKTIKCCTDNFVLLVAVTLQKIAPSTRHDPARVNPVPDRKVEDTILKLLECFSDDAVLTRETLLAGKVAWRDPVAGTVPDAGRNP